MLIEFFDTWQPGYGLATVSIFRAGTTTLASVYTDESLTAAAANPQVLIERLGTDSISYGRFQVPLYIGVAYELKINSVDTTGVVRPPLTTLVGQDASQALVTANNGAVAIALGDYATRIVDVRNYGPFLQVGVSGASASTNNASLVSAIGAVGFGYVEIPGGTFAVTSFTIPQGIVLRGVGRAATILQSTFAGNVVTIGGARAGLTRMTLDGVTLVSNSVGVYAANVDQIVLDDFEIKRIETGLWQKGGSLSNWRGLFISACVNGYKGHGDSAAGLGGILRFNAWRGGKVELCTGVGIEFKYVDALCQNNVIADVTFDTNTGTAVNIVGARHLPFQGCQWITNGTVLAVADASPATAFNTVFDLTFSDGQIDSGAITFADTFRDVIFRRMKIVAPTVNIAAPGQNILVEDCEVASPVITGVPTCWLYHQSNFDGASFILAPANTTVKAWATTLKSGSKVYLEAKVIGRQYNGTNTGFYHISVSAGRPGATLLYDTQTANFTVGQQLTGATSKAIAVIVADTDAGASGTLTLYDVIGTFVDNEIIADALGGSALANGAISESAAALVGGVTSIRAAQETDAAWDATFVANGPQIELRVTTANQIVQWTVDVEMLQDIGTASVVAGAAVSIVGINDASANKLDYVSAHGSFTPGGSLVGLSSGATGTITADAPSGTSGTLTLSGIVGAYVSGEPIQNGVIFATANGVLHT